MKNIRFFQSIQIRLIVIYVLLILIAIQLIGIYFVKALETSFVKTFSESLNKQAYLLSEYVEPYLLAHHEGRLGDNEGSADDLHLFVSNFNSISKAAIQIIDASGVVVSTSLASQRSLIGQKNTNTEVNRALQGIRMNEATVIDEQGVRSKVIALPVENAGKVIGAVYIDASMEDMYATINRVTRILFLGTIIALALTAILGVILSGTITNPIKVITKQAAAVAEGDFNSQVNVIGHDEIGKLGEAFNYMTNRLKEALSLNEEEKEKLASILANMSDGVMATDDLGKVILINRRARQMLQLEESEAIGQDIADLLGMPKAQLGQHVLGDNHTVMINLKVPDEETLNVRVSFTPIHRRSRGVSGTIAVLQDVTEQEKMEHSRREFVANVSHELRTPLTTIKSYLEALDDGAIEDAQLASRFIGITRNETERMIRLVTDLLHLSRFDSKQAVIAKEETDIVKMLEEVADRFSFHLKQRDIDISLNVSSDLPYLQADSDQIDQVLDNLVSNAIKYTPDHGFIEIAARKTEKNQLEISIQDTGIGIPKKDLERIFERFYRVDKARSRSMGGTGLGLSIAREIIRAHGGTIEIESEAGQGTRVAFTLPLQPEEVPA